MKTRILLTVAVTSALLVGCDQGGSDSPSVNNSTTVSPVRGIERGDLREPDLNNDFLLYRSLDGSNNNGLLTDMNTSHSQLARMVSPDYADLVAAPSGATRPSARAISNQIAAQSGSHPNGRRASDFLWQWGQFLDHDLDLTDGVAPAESANISVPMGDPWFDPDHTGTVEIPLNRSIFDEATGDHVLNPRQQINEITGWIDASNVYGSDASRARALRNMDGTGMLATSAGDLLPYNLAGLANAGGSGPELFLAGDVRANEQVGLAVMHTLFVREHNRLARDIATSDPSLTGEQIYQRARRIVGAQMQVITYREFLPVLLGEGALKSYAGYDETVDASVSNIFSSAAYRLGHSMLSDKIRRLDAQGNEIPEGHLALQDAFFRPDRIVTEGGIEPVLRGLAGQICESIDAQVVDDVRNALFGAPGAGGFDLAALNIQRGRDHGLPSYNETRRQLGLSMYGSFSEITANPALADALSAVYGSVDQIDLWVGGLAETPTGQSALGPLFHTIVVDQFERLRDGDRFWYQNTFFGDELAMIESTTLADIIRRNTGIGPEISDNVFVVP
ncbi:MAG: peroxidase family protein [Pseudomonadota bacterium]